MNSMERVMACVSGTATDRPAKFMALSLYGAKLTGCELDKYYSDPDEYVKGQERVIEEFRPDIILSPFSIAKEIQAFGGGARYYANQPPNIVRNPVSINQSLESVVWPDVDSNKHVLYFREAIRKMAQRLCGEIPIAAPIMGPFEMAVGLISIERLMEMILFDLPAASELLSQCMKFSVRWANMLLDDGANIVVHVSTFGNAAVITPDIAQRIVLPVLNKVYTGINGPIILHHGGAKIKPLINIFNSIPNLTGVAVDKDDDLLECRGLIGDKKLLLGNIDGPSMVFKSPEEIEFLCTDKLEQMASDKHFILSTTSADVAYDTSIEQIKAMVHAVEKF